MSKCDGTQVPTLVRGGRIQAAQKKVGDTRGRSSHFVTSANLPAIAKMEATDADKAQQEARKKGTKLAEPMLSFFGDSALQHFKH